MSCDETMQSGMFPAKFKTAYLTPLLKRPDLDVSDVRSYRPISNLTVISKILERLVSKSLVAFLEAFDLLT